MHYSKVGVVHVAFYKISACLLCTFSAFRKTCRLMGFFTVIHVLCLHTYQIGSNYNKNDKSNYHQQY